MDWQRILGEALVLAPPFLAGLTFHELAHGMVADRLGDPTPRAAGRLTLNPLKHLDPLGVVFFFLVKIGWAKPVQVNPGYFRNPERDMMLVALAGPAANLVLAVLSALLLRGLLLLPLPAAMELVLLMLAASVWINVMLAVFNLLPVPPLDGSRILRGVLPRGLRPLFDGLERWGFLLLLLLFYTGVIGKVLRPIMNLGHRLLLP